ncbi:peptidogalycan biosysnthesis protein [Streptomyces silvisoli]|uniref:Peptidogalycan biosysnthesis protein n=1 Tax=Streptomyces silvisoli TaxID=3034235 RepID=A0ABT5ZLH8_9ACTN|nr:peptidogalycan biosysnthesis protein [Streptomyces silvisoli]MDF3290682.1 peptidogalycan biosysnthesis protein [Streptomyces silvisoli]
MHVSSYDSFSRLPAADWDALTTGATIYSTSGFLGVREEELPQGASGHHLLARDGSGRPVAGLETYAFPRPPHLLYTPADMLAGLVDDERHARLAARPLAIAAGWSEFRGQLPGRDGVTPPERASAVDALTAEAFRFAAEAGASVLAYYYLPREEALEVARAHADAGAVLLYHDVETVLPVGLWRDLDEYLAWLPSGRRPRARREARAFRDSGRTIREVRLPEVVGEIAPLNSALMHKHGHDYDEKRAATVYDRQGRYLGGCSTLLLDEDAGRPVGFALRYRQRDMLYARVAGFDYSVPNVADYFNLVFYHPIAQGTGRTDRAIHLGLGTFQAKLARGAQPRPLYSVFVGVDRPLDADETRVRERNRTGTAAFGAEYGQFVVGGLNTDDWLLDS